MTEILDSNIKLPLAFQSEEYKKAYSRINAIVIIGEQHAFENFLQLTKLIPDHADQLLLLARMESRHKKSFQACGRNLQVTPDLDFAKQFFTPLHRQFQDAVDQGKVVTCLLIQALIIECFAISAYDVYIPVADPFAQKITMSVMQDEYSHLSFGEIWLKEHFEVVRDEVEAANRQVLPLVWQMLSEVEADAKTLGMTKFALLEGFITRYGEALHTIGFSNRDVVRMSTQGLATA